MEFSTLIDQLDDVLTSAKRVPLSSDLRIDKDAAAAIVEQLRGAIPDELREAHWIAENRDEMLAEARSEAAQILQDAREDGARLLTDDAIAKGAELRARQLIEAARTTERELHLAGEQHALDTLEGLEAHLEKLAAAVAQGRSRLAERNPDQRIEREPDRLVARSGNGALQPKTALA